MGVIRCNYCKKVHLKSDGCKAKSSKLSQQHREGRYSKLYDWVYNNGEWKVCKDIVIDTQVCCVRCKAIKGIDRLGEHVHHIVPLSRDVSKAYTLSNLMLLCSECHSHIHKAKLVLDFEYDVEYWINKYKDIIGDV